MCPSPKVYFISLEAKETTLSLAKKTKKILKAAGFERLARGAPLVAIKQHFGEEGNKGYIKPEVTKTVVDFVKKEEASPVVVETNTLYRGRRSNSYDHLMLAYEHGFSIESLGAPVIILDGLNGQNQHQVEIPGQHFKTVYVASDLLFFGAMIVLSHVKGHMASGMGGAIKNLAMGFASRAGKLAQHADFKPVIKDKCCVRCGLCASYCPVSAIRLIDNRIQVNIKRCIGCGECYIACLSDAISFEWGSADRVFQEKMAEHALGAVINHKGKVGYLNYFYHVTKQCDCWGSDNPVCFPNVGLFASEDPVAIDKACLDIGCEVLGEDIFHCLWPKIDPRVQIEHGERIGLGSQIYELINIR